MLKPITLKNGLTVLRMPKVSANTFIMGFVATTGSSVEEGLFANGISRIVEKLFWYGTDKHPSPRSLNLALEGLGGTYFSHTGRELTQFYLTAPSYHQYKAVSLLAEIMQHSYFDARDLESEKRNLIEKFKQEDSDFAKESENLALSNLFQNVSLGMPVEGSVDTVLSIQSEDILEYLAHQYRPDRSFLVVAGNFDNKAVMELIEQEWTFWNPKSKKYLEPVQFTKKDIGDLPRLSYRQRGLSQTKMVLAFLLDGGMQPQILNELNSNNIESKDDIQIEPKELLDELLSDWAKLLVLNAALGQGFSSRLWTKGVEEEMFFEKAQSDLKLYSNTGYLQIAGTCDNSQFTFALESILSILEALKKTTISINELTKAKEYVKGRLLLEHEDLLTSTIWQIEHLVGSGLTFELEDLLDKINQVEAASLRSLALDLFVPERMALTTLGTAKETRLVDKLIQKYLG